jgi:hypothetical protein
MPGPPREAFDDFPEWLAAAGEVAARRGRLEDSLWWVMVPAVGGGLGWLWWAAMLHRTVVRIDGPRLHVRRLVRSEWRRLDEVRAVRHTVLQAGAFVEPVTVVDFADGTHARIRHRLFTNAGALVDAVENGRP